MTKIAWISCLLLLGQAQIEFAQTGAHVSGERELRRATYIQLNRQIFARHEDADSEKFHISKPDKVAEIRYQLHKLISDEISSVLNGPTPSADAVKTAITNIQGEMALPVDDMTNTPFAASFELNGIQSLAVAYAILEGGEAIPDTQAYLEFYDRSNGSWEMKAEAPTRSDFRGRTFFVSQMDSGIPGEAWFLAWGMRIGNPGTPVNVRLYGFDGNAVRTVWKRDGLTRGLITASKDSVTLEYDREYNPSGPTNRVHETLHVSPSVCSD
jgi:hypothetical protein